MFEAPTAGQLTFSYVAFDGSDVDDATVTIDVASALEWVGPIEDITVDNEPGKSGATVVFEMPSTVGGTGEVIVACNPATGSFFAIGDTTVSCTAPSGVQGAAPISERFVETATPAEQEISTTFTVTVDDSQPPVFIATPPAITVDRLDSTGVAIVVDYDVPVATDNSGEPMDVSCSLLPDRCLRSARPPSPAPSSMVQVEPHRRVSTSRSAPGYRATAARLIRGTCNCLRPDLTRVVSLAWRQRSPCSACSFRP